jgi:diphthamide synthase (EF-2-diphthine--ammonia ligase)
LYLADLRAYREEKLAAIAMRAEFPLWGLDTRELARNMVRSGLGAVLTCIDPKKLPRSLAGRTFDDALLDELPTGVDACGENGEFHTFTWKCGAFREPIAIEVGKTVERDGFVFTDVRPR